ncbi:MAG: signal peptidase I [Longimicrobiales bacterium]
MAAEHLIYPLEKIRVIDNATLQVETARPPSPLRWVWEWAKSLLIAFVLFLFIRTFLVEAFRIPTGSMENTLLVGDFLLVNKAVFGAQIPIVHLNLPALAQPRRGEVVVFMPPHDQGKYYVKRVLGMPGDTIEMREKRLYVNRRRQREPYVRLGSQPGDAYAPSMIWQCDFRPSNTRRRCRPTRDNWGPVVVPPGNFLMLGDNRDDSEDSRYWGFVERSAIKGRPLFIYYSFDASRLRVLPWLTEIRWNRIGGVIS